MNAKTRRNARGWEKRGKATRFSLPLIRYLSSPSRGESAKIKLVAALGSSIILYRRYEVSTDEVPGRPKKVQGKNRLERWQTPYRFYLVPLCSSLFKPAAPPRPPLPPLFRPTLSSHERENPLLNCSGATGKKCSMASLGSTLLRAESHTARNIKLNVTRGKVQRGPRSRPIFSACRAKRLIAPG